MPFVARAQEVIRALLGVSAYENGKAVGADLGSSAVKRIREAMGGQIQPLPTTRLRWYLKDLEIAQRNADSGNLMMAAQLYRSFQRDGVIAGLLGTRCAGLVRLPKRFYGDDEIARALQANNGSRSVFDEMFPPSELTMVDKDGVALGVGVAELVPVDGRDYPVMVRLDPENLQYRWTENRWYFTSTAGLLPITPGDGHWILHLPGARMAPWNAGLWPAIGRSFINKEHALLCRSNYSAKLANPARVAIPALGASEPERKNFFRRVAAWGINSIFEMPIGWDVKLLESNGNGIQVFQKEIDTSDFEAMVAVSGQVVTTTGGTGFANANIHQTIRGDLIKSDGDGLAYTINTQGLPLYLATGYGVDAIEKRFTSVEWNTATPVELKSEAETYASLATAITGLADALAKVQHDDEINIDALMTRFAIPMNRRAAGVTDDSTALQASEFATPVHAKALSNIRSMSIAQSVAARLATSKLEEKEAA